MFRMILRLIGNGIDIPFDERLEPLLPVITDDIAESAHVPVTGFAHQDQVDIFTEL